MHATGVTDTLCASLILAGLMLQADTGLVLAKLFLTARNEQNIAGFQTDIAHGRPWHAAAPLNADYRETGCCLDSGLQHGAPDQP